MACAASASARQTRAYAGISFGPEGPSTAATFDDVQGVAIDQSDGDVYVYDMVGTGAFEGRLYKFGPSGEPLVFSDLGVDVIEGIGQAGEDGAGQVAVAPEGSPDNTAGYIYVATNTAVRVYSPAGTELGTLGEGETCGVAVDPAGQVFVGSFGETIREYTPSADPTADVKTGEGTVAINLCNVGADGASNVYASSFDGAKSARLEGIADANPILIEPGGATLATDPLTNELYLDQGDHVSAYGTPAAPSYEFGAGELTRSFGVAVRSSTDRVYVADGGTGTVKVFGPPLSVPTTEPATAVGTETATLHGTVYPEGRQYTDCRFQYGLVSASGFEDVGNCEPEAAQIDPNSASQAVSLSLDGLQSNSEYKFRLVVTNSAGTIEGETLTFSTVGPPRITEILSRADRESATLEATVDPRGSDSSYRIEWGPTDSYGHLAATGSVAGGQGPTRVTAQLLGLAEGSSYHFRIVAGNVEGGEATSPDQLVETLNSCGFTDGRCLELVSRADKGPLAQPGKKVVVGATLQFQAAVGGSALAYNVQSGYPETNAGLAAVLYLGRRGAQGWSSDQLAPPAVVPPINANEQAENTLILPFSPDLRCGALTSNAPLTPDAPATVVEAGGSNLFISDYATRTYRLITNLPPVNPSAQNAGYVILGMSPDCGRVFFRTPFRYPGIPAAIAGYQLYEWDHGTLRGLALIPGPGGGGDPVPAELVTGGLSGPDDGSDYWRAVSADGSQSIFAAVSQFGADSGQEAIFDRDANDPAVAAGTTAAIDISQSETATPNDGSSRYWIASTDGRRIFFTARYRLAANGSSSGATQCLNALSGGSGEGCDLYEYDSGAAAGARLTDLSADSADAKGAGVVGVLDASEDGSYVYFAARGRLGGAGRTEAQNLKADTYNIYLAHAGEVSFVHTLGGAEARDLNALVNTGLGRWTSRSTPSGTGLAFESSVGTPGGVPMVYLFSAPDGTTVCVSCRRDGRVPYAGGSLTPLPDALETNAKDKFTQPTILTDNGRLYFYSFDPLAPHAVEGQRNLYQWEHGQVSLVASEPSGVPRTRGVPLEVFFAGADADGNDVYFGTPQRLAGGAEDGWNVYDARVGGGFPEPTPPQAPCDASAEGICNGGTANPPASTTPATSNFGGPGNPAAKKKRRQHRTKNHRGKHHKHRRQHRKARGGNAGEPGPADGNGRAGE